jgi:uncharacterized protein
MLSYNVVDLLRSAPGTSQRIPLDVADLPIADDVRLASPIAGEVRLSRTSRSILVRGHLDTALAERCSRCLRPAVAPVSVDLDEEALPSIDLDSGLPLDVTEDPDALRLNDHHELDLAPALRDAISLAEPIAALCRPDCPGLCVVCGADLTDDPEHAHPDADIDPRLAPLEALRRDLDPAAH